VYSPTPKASIFAPQETQRVAPPWFSKPHIGQVTVSAIDFSSPGRSARFRARANVEARGFAREQTNETRAYARR
jgi:hypothetical protein